MRRAARALAAWAVVALAGAGAAQEADAALRLVHASPDAPRVDLVVDGEAVVRDLDFGTVGPYVVLAAGEHEVRVFPHRPPEGGAAGEPRRLEPVAVLVTLAPGAYHTVTLSGFFEPPPAEGQTGSLSLNVEPDDVAYTIRGPRSYSAEFVGDQLVSDLDPGEYRIDARLEGFRASAYRVDVAALQTTTLSISLQRGDAPEGGAEPPPRVPAAGAEGGAWRTVELHLYTDAYDAPPPGFARVRIVHASPVTPEVAVEVVAGETGPSTALIDGLSFPNAGPYVAVRGGVVGFRVRLAGSSTVVTEVPALPFRAGASYTLLLVGDPGDEFVRVLPVLDGLLAPTVLREE